MNPGGMFKVVIWLAPVLAFLFWYISQKQDAQVDDMKADFAQFDENFARMNGGLSTGSEKAEWKAVQTEAHERHNAAMSKAAASNQKAEDTFSQMEKELMNSDADKIIEENK